MRNGKTGAMQTRSQIMSSAFDILRFWIDMLRKHRKKQLAKKFFSSFVSKGDLCFDVGANIGDMTELFIEMGMHVVSVEPQPACVSKLKERFDCNSMVSIVEAGLGAGSGETDMHICEGINVLSTISEKWIKHSRFASNQRVNWDNKIKIKLSTLDALINQYGKPRFCKIDVEGYETNVVKGLTQPIKFVSFEFMKEFLGDAEKTLKHLQAISNIRVNYSVAEKYEYESFSSRWGDVQDVMNELKKSEDPKLWGDIYVEMQE